MLFHGTPGLGKTLTCEAIAEKMHRPLYSVTVGDIGTDSTTVERNLSKIISLSHRWMAIILLDEADIFLEQRTINDIQRNALVGIFLRILEKYSGIFILTTNRVDTIDEAFKSRISIFLKYSEFSVDYRFKVITKLLAILIPTNIVSQEYIGTMSNLKLNGRQIKNYIRMANCLAMARGENLGDKHIAQIIDINEDV
jgi:SpoVK/Ycf46/Vps4 family AAA+-type ATPase